MLLSRLASDSPGGATSNSKMSKLKYYRHVEYIVALVCAKKSYNYLLWFARYSGKCRVALFFGPPCTVLSLWRKLQQPIRDVRHCRTTWKFQAKLQLLCISLRISTYIGVTNDIGPLLGLYQPLRKRCIRANFYVDR